MDRKAELLDTAEGLVRRHGFDGMSFADVATAHGIKTASVHYHFPGKAALGAALMQRYRLNMQAALAALTDAGLTPSDRIAWVIDRYRGAMNGGDSLCLCVALSVNRDTLADPITLEMRGFRGMMLDWLEKVYREMSGDAATRPDVAPKAQAATALAVLEGAQLIAHAEHDPGRFDAAVQGLLPAV